MASLHGILAELGIEAPIMHPEREELRASRWVTDDEFVPAQGKVYELAFGRVPNEGEGRPVIRRVRIDGLTPDQWFDLDLDRPLTTRLQSSPVKAFRLIA